MRILKENKTPLGLAGAAVATIATISGIYLYQIRGNSDDKTPSTQGTNGTPPTSQLGTLDKSDDKKKEEKIEGGSTKKVNNKEEGSKKEDKKKLDKADKRKVDKEDKKKVEKENKKKKDKEDKKKEDKENKKKTDTEDNKKKDKEDNKKVDIEDKKKDKKDETKKDELNVSKNITNNSDKTLGNKGKGATETKVDETKAPIVSEPVIASQGVKETLPKGPQETIPPQPQPKSKPKPQAPKPKEGTTAAPEKAAPEKGPNAPAVEDPKFPKVTGSPAETTGAASGPDLDDSEEDDEPKIVVSLDTLAGDKPIENNPASIASNPSTTSTSTSEDKSKPNLHALVAQAPINASESSETESDIASLHNESSSSDEVKITHTIILPAATNTVDELKTTTDANKNTTDNSDDNSLTSTNKAPKSSKSMTTGKTNDQTVVADITTKTTEGTPETLVEDQTADPPKPEPNKKLAEDDKEVKDLKENEAEKKEEDKKIAPITLTKTLARVSEPAIAQEGVGVKETLPKGPQETISPQPQAPKPKESTLAAAAEDLKVPKVTVNYVDTTASDIKSDESEVDEPEITVSLEEPRSASAVPKKTEEIAVTSTSTTENKPKVNSPTIIPFSEWTRKYGVSDSDKGVTFFQTIILPTVEGDGKQLATDTQKNAVVTSIVDSLTVINASTNKAPDAAESTALTDMKEGTTDTPQGSSNEVLKPSLEDPAAQPLKPKEPSEIEAENKREVKYMKPVEEEDLNIIDEKNLQPFTPEAGYEKFKSLYVEKSSIGSGGQASVHKGYLVAEDATTIPVAVKYFSSKIDASNESQYLSKLSGKPYISQLFGYTDSEKGSGLVLQLLEGGDFEAKGHTSSLEVAQKWMMQMTVALQHIHNAGIIHRDLKPNNVMLDKKGDAYIIDFGFSKTCSEVVSPQANTPFYCAPEVLEQISQGYESEIFSLAITFLRIVCENYDELFELMGKFKDDGDYGRICRRKNWMLYEMRFADYLPDSVQDLFWRMIEDDPKERLTIPQVMSHPFFEDSKLKWDDFGALPFEKVKLESKLKTVKEDFPDVSSTTRRINEDAEKGFSMSSNFTWNSFEMDNKPNDEEKKRLLRPHFFKGEIIGFEFRKLHLKDSLEPLFVKTYTNEQEFLKNQFLLAKLKDLSFIHAPIWSGTLSEEQGREAFKNEKKRFVMVFERPPSGLILHGFPNMIKDKDLLNITRELKNSQITLLHMAHLVVALQHLHARGIILNGTNAREAFCFPDGTIKLCDLSKARYFDPKTPSKVSEVEVTFFSAPESITKGTCSYNSDIYSLGLIFYEYVKYTLLPEHNIYRLYAIACDADAASHDGTVSKFKERLKMKEEICKLPLSMACAPGVAELTRRMLDPDPNNRITLTQIMNHDAFKDINWKELGALDAPLIEK